MKNLYANKILTIALILISTVGFGQSNEIKIRFIGNCGLYLTDGTSNIYMDFPYKSGAHNYMEYDQSELENIKANSVFIYTHKHSDHYSKKVKKAKGKVYGPWNIDKMEQLNSAIPDFKIEAFKTKHRFILKHYSYQITWHGKKLYFSGDTEHAETIGTMSSLDYAFIPYWLMVDAKEKNIKVDTKMRVLYHLYPTQKIDGEIPADVIILDKQGKVITIAY